MPTDTVWRAAIGAGIIILVFAIMAGLMYMVRRTHTRRFGGITIFQVLRGRFPRWPRRKRRSDGRKR